MTFEIALVLAILAAALVLFIGEWIRMDVVALLVLGTLAITGLVAPDEAFSGFSNTAVITVWAMFILSDGLTRTGIANVIGRQVMRLAGRREVAMIVVIMLTAGFLSAFMNNIGVAALMLPVVVDIARRTRVSPSRLLMPLAYASLLGGLMTMIGTPPNLLVSNAMAGGGYEPFGLFDFTPVGVVVMLAGTLFVALVGRLFLPKRKTQKRDRGRSQRALRSQYKLAERTFTLRIPQNSMLVGKTLGESRITSAADLVVLALQRFGRSETLPNRQTTLRAGDELLVQGQLDRFSELRRLSDLVIEREAPVLQSMVAEQLARAEVVVADSSPLVGDLVAHIGFRQRFGADLLAIQRRDQSPRRTNLAYVPLRAGDRLLLQGRKETMEALHEVSDFAEVSLLDADEVTKRYGADDRLFVVRVPRESELAGRTLGRTRLTDVFDFKVLATFRDGNLDLLPGPDTELAGSDLLLIQGEPGDLDVLRALQGLDLDSKPSMKLSSFESRRLAMQDATLDPRSSLVGKSVAELNFRERYGLELVGIWRNGAPVEEDLRDVRLALGDALLLVGPREKLELLERDPDFLVLTPLGKAPPDTRRAPVAAGIMLGVVTSVLVGWLPIQVAAVFGATLMVLTGCLSMEQAYRAIEWRAIFLIAGMLPLGTAMQDTGAAAWIAGHVLSVTGDAGPWPVIFSLYAMTAISTVVIPPAVLVVIMAPIVLSAMADMGLAPETAMMAMAVAAAASFMSPISHPANILVMGPGGYRFADYLRVGVPLTLVVFAVVMVVLPVIWPLRPA